ncbi:Sec-independent protein translocase subunit TatB [Wolbachia endosymbiont of Chironomus riparius]|uniref:Sec-independent protein translocase subunit TatB n=1 Tax=Wolbachia endosymbiont of Chironomus riparius TaxID=2883238 RepID=UPI0020A0EF87|nr:hypothetical protein [Wolbachia endosymbiont of Chironomus riparius]
MFNIGFTEILVVALVGVIAFDKEKMPEFINFVKAVYRYVMSIRFKAKQLLKNSVIEELCDTEEINYIIGKDGKSYPAYNIDNTSNQKNDSENPCSR